MSILQNQDPEVFKALKHEDERQENSLEMIASENFVSQAVLESSRLRVWPGLDHPLCDDRRGCLDDLEAGSPRSQTGPDSLVGATRPERLLVRVFLRAEESRPRLP